MTSPECFPDHILVQLLSYLPPPSVARAICTCVRWRFVGSSDALWRQLCRSAINKFHPRPRTRMIHESDDVIDDMGGNIDMVSLSISHQQTLDRRRADAAAAALEEQRLADFRAGVIAGLRDSVASSRCYRLPFLCIPMVRTSGVYTLRHEYIRSGVRDMFHNYEGILRCVYHRTLLLRDDGTLLYSMLPGEYTEAFKDFRRTLTAVSAANAVQSSIGSSDEPVTSVAIPPAARGVGGDSSSLSLRTSGAFTPGMGTATLGPRTSQAHHGTYHLEGSTLVALVRCAHNITLRWHCDVASVDGGLCNRLVVQSMHLLEGTPGLGTESSTLMTQVADEEFVWRPAPVLALLTGTMRGPRFI